MVPPRGGEKGSRCESCASPLLRVSERKEGLPRATEGSETQDLGKAAVLGGELEDLPWHESVLHAPRGSGGGARRWQSMLRMVGAASSQAFIRYARAAG